MIKEPLLFIFLSLLIVVSPLGPASAQSGEESAGKAAEQAGRLREALTHYVAALQSVSEGSVDDQRLRETIIRLVQKLSPPPAIPEEATRFSVRGEIAIKEAKSTGDFAEAAKEFSKAMRVAPWWADGYINLAVAQEKAGQLNEAILSLKFYLLAAPASPDADKVKRQIYALEYRQEKAQKEKDAAQKAAAYAAEQERKRREEEMARLQNISGDWISAEGRTRFSVSRNGNSVDIAMTEGYAGTRWWPQNDLRCRGTVDGSTINGTCMIDQTFYSNGSVFTRPMTARIGSDGRTIHLIYTGVVPNGAVGRRANGWRDSENTFDLQRR